MEPLVAIGVPVYNGEEYLYECLQSIYNQSYKNWKCFIINNQSTDETPAIGKKFEQIDKRFKLITNESFVEMIVNFNNAVKSISDETDYFKVVCADDWLYPEYLTRIVSLMEEYPETGIGLSFRLDHLKVGCVGLNYYDGPRFRGKDILLRELKGVLNVSGSETTALYRIKTLKKLSSYPQIFSPNSYNFDTSLAYDLLNISDLAFVFQVLSYTRRHEDTYTSKYKDKFRTTLNSREYELFRHKDQFPELEKIYKIVRQRYGMVHLKRRFKKDTEFITWHKKWLSQERRFSSGEYVAIVFKSMLDKVFKKNKG